jgi:hypothetical protein
MPPAASENAPRDLFGRSLANRRCSEWRAAVGRIAAALKERRKPGFGWADENSGRHGGPASRRERSRREADLTEAAIRLEPPGGRKGSSDPDQPPDGTHRRLFIAGRSFAGPDGRKALTDRPGRQA